MPEIIVDRDSRSYDIKVVRNTITVEKSDKGFTIAKSENKISVLRNTKSIDVVRKQSNVTVKHPHKTYSIHDGGPRGVKGDPGDKGDTGQGVPTGGSTGQVLAKSSSTDFDTEWVDQTGGGGGGSGDVVGPGSSSVNEFAMFADDTGKLIKNSFGMTHGGVGANTLTSWGAGYSFNITGGNFFQQGNPVVSLIDEDTFYVSNEGAKTKVHYWDESIQDYYSSAFAVTNGVATHKVEPSLTELNVLGVDNFSGITAQLIAITAQSTPIEMTILSGELYLPFFKFTRRIKDNGTARAITWDDPGNLLKVADGLTLPTTTTPGKTLHMEFISDYDLTINLIDVKEIG